MGRESGERAVRLARKHPLVGATRCPVSGQTHPYWPKPCSLTASSSGESSSSRGSSGNTGSPEPEARGRPGRPSEPDVLGGGDGATSSAARAAPGSPPDAARSSRAAVDTDTRGGSSGRLDAAGAGCSLHGAGPADAVPGAPPPAGCSAAPRPQKRVRPNMCRCTYTPVWRPTRAAPDTIRLPFPFCCTPLALRAAPRCGALPAWHRSRASPRQKHERPAVWRRCRPRR